MAFLIHFQSVACICEPNHFLHVLVFAFLQADHRACADLFALYMFNLLGGPGRCITDETSQLHESLDGFQWNTIHDV